MAYDISRNVAFTTNSINYELFSNSNIKAAIMTRMKFTTDSQYNDFISNGIHGLKFCVMSSSRISVNNEPYENNEPLMGVVSCSCEETKISIKSIRVEDNNVNGTFYFNII